jgi:uncharacterized protein YbcV (DUF1398 family)
MNTEIIHDTCQQSVTNNLPFPDVLRRLHRAGVERYWADLVQRQKTYYSASGEVCVSPLKTESLGVVAERFDAQEIQKFLRGIVAAGTFAYTVHTGGRRAVYLGRAGDIHIEPFPPEK